MVTNYYRSGLTVVVPIYNVDKYLTKCIQSLLDQTITVEEIILVDDGSTDSSGMIADSFAENYERIRVIHQKNGGLSAARNTGIDNTKTEYITFVDSDDYVDSNMYEVLLKNMDSKNADISIGGVWREDTEGNKSSVYTPGIIKTWNKKEALIQLNSYSYFNMSFCDKVFKRELFEIDAYGTRGVRFPVGKTSEDYYTMHQVVARANKIVYVSDPFYHYVQRMGSISRNTRINKEPLNAAISQMEFYQKWFPDIAYVGETACAFSHMGLYSAYLRKKMKCPKEELHYARTTVKKYINSVMRNGYIPKIKKAQAFSFCYMLPLYSYIISRTEHR